MDDPTQAIAILEARATAHAGTLPSADKNAATREILRSFVNHPENLICWARWMAGQTGPTAKELGAALLTETYPQHKGEALALLQGLAGDTNCAGHEWA